MKSAERESNIIQTKINSFLPKMDEVCYIAKVIMACIYDWDKWD